MQALIHREAFQIEKFESVFFPWAAQAILFSQSKQNVQLMEQMDAHEGGIENSVFCSETYIEVFFKVRKTICEYINICRDFKFWWTGIFRNQKDSSSSTLIYCIIFYFIHWKWLLVWANQSLQSWLLYWNYHRKKSSNLKCLKLCIPC